MTIDLRKWSRLVWILLILTASMAIAIIIHFSSLSLEPDPTPPATDEFVKKDSEVAIKNSYDFMKFGVSPNIFSHQGIARDSTNFYTFDTNTIYKYDSDWKKQNTSNRVNQKVNIGTNHLGDGEEFGGELYVPIENYRNCRRNSNQNIAIFDSKTLSYSRHFDISHQRAEVSSLTIDARAGQNGVIYTSSFCDGSKLWKYDLKSGQFLGTTKLPVNIPSIQGISYRDGNFYITEDRKDLVWRINLKESTANEILHYSARYLEGIDYTGDWLLLTADQGKGVKTISFWRPKTDLRQ